MVRALVDREKPAHSIHGLPIRYPAMQIGNDPDLNPEFGMGLDPVLIRGRSQPNHHPRHEDHCTLKGTPMADYLFVTPRS